ncbi:MAG: thiamine phosphate synthase [Kiloniellales bacterium]|nr:thiamine phosphate synthase [Kiloniellales bacterium]
MRLPDPPLLVITDRRAAKRPLEAVAEEIFAAGCRWLSLRDKDLPEPERLALLRRLTALAEGSNALVTVHGHGVGAAARAARGLHLDRSGDAAAARLALGPTALIGLSAHDDTEAQAAAKGGADYVTFSPVFPSLSKPGYGPTAGLEGLRELTRRSRLPIVALGGIAAGNAAACLEAGAAGLAVIGSVMAQDSPGRAVAALLEQVEGYRERSSLAESGNLR